MSKVFDLFIIGGGINGAGIARDAAGRGSKWGVLANTELGGSDGDLESETGTHGFYGEKVFHA